MASENEALIRRWFDEVWNQKREETIDELMDENIIIHGLPNAGGRAAFKDFHRQFCAAFPDIRIRVELTMSQGDIVVHHSTVEGTHRGLLFGITPSERVFRIGGTGIARVRNGKFVEAWDQYDFLKLYGQIGALKQIEALSNFASA